MLREVPGRANEATSNTETRKIQAVANILAFDCNQQCLTFDSDGYFRKSIPGSDGAWQLMAKCAPSGFQLAKIQRKFMKCGISATVVEITFGVVTLLSNLYVFYNIQDHGVDRTSLQLTNLFVKTSLST